MARETAAVRCQCERERDRDGSQVRAVAASEIWLSRRRGGSRHTVVVASAMEIPSRVGRSLPTPVEVWLLYREVGSRRSGYSFVVVVGWCGSG